MLHLFRKHRVPPPDLQAAADAAAWRQLLRRRPDLAERIRLALAAGTPVESILEGAASTIASAAEEPRRTRLGLLLPCAVHGCARSLGLLAPSARAV